MCLTIVEDWHTYVLQLFEQLQEFRCQSCAAGTAGRCVSTLCERIAGAGAAGTPLYLRATPTTRA